MLTTRTSLFIFSFFLGLKVFCAEPAIPVSSTALPTAATTTTEIPTAANIPPVAAPPRSAFDLRSMREVYKNQYWPSTAFDIKKISGNLTLAQIAAKDLNFKKKMLKQYCREYTQFYSDEVTKDEKINDIGSMFAQVCDVFEQAVDEAKVAGPYLFEIPNNGVIKKLDLIRLGLAYSPGKADLRRVEEMEKTYQSSLLGKLGIPMKQNFIVTQIVLLITFILALIGAVKALFG